MDRKTYIKRLEGLREDVLKLQEKNGQIEQLGLPDDFTALEGDIRKGINSSIDKLAERLYTAVAVSARVQADNAANGKGNQGDLDFANGGAADDLPLDGTITHEDIAIAQEAEKARLAAKKAKGSKKKGGK